MSSHHAEAFRGGAEDGGIRSAWGVHPGWPVGRQKSAHPPKLIPQVYIGKSDVLDERLRRHRESKEFWSTALAFYRPAYDLHGGQITQLEAHLIRKAEGARGGE